MPTTKRRLLVPLFILSAIAAWFGYLWFVSGVIVSKERYPGGKIKAEGYLKRAGWSEYRPHGRWETFHENGQMSSTGLYVNGRMDGLWKYWDESGRELPSKRFVNGDEVDFGAASQPDRQAEPSERAEGKDVRKERP